ncbi:MAG: alpha-L-fucosidase [Lachnospiraceae bacterium]|nr:alpha-L-fucosidase [Lachnospiraceae bacterium]
MRTALDERLIKVVPSRRQVEFQSLEFYAFVHFTINTFTGQEWGDGTENPAIFDPQKLDAEQWVTAIKAAGMRGLILTCKHHDGFCLWPSRYTKHTIAASPYRNGQGDIVREVSEACRRHGIRFGIYLSPWDRHEESYGTGAAYDDYFVNQLTELLTNYGDIFCVWLDGACGEGKNGKKQYYDWERYYEVIRRLQPGACINVCGPDIRWCGNEAGDTRPSEWSVVPLRTKDTEKIAAKSQQEDSEQFRQRKICAWDWDLGSREILAQENDLIWYPAEVNTSIRPGWFYHPEEDDKVRSLEELIHIYQNSVGGNATFLLNIPPTTEGLFHENDVRRLQELGEYLQKAFAVNLLERATLTASPETVICAEWKEPVAIGNIVLKENILLSQRVERFVAEARIHGEYEKIYEGTVIGYKKIIPLKSVRTDSLRIRILDVRVAPAISFLGVYEAVE